eukprot:28754-Pelagococcus_subviridis.AAC.2
MSIERTLARSSVSVLVCLCALSSLMFERNCEKFSYDKRARACRKNSFPSTFPPSPSPWSPQVSPPPDDGAGDAAPAPAAATPLEPPRGGDLSPPACLTW